MLKLDNTSSLFHELSSHSINACPKPYPFLNLFNSNNVRVLLVDHEDSFVHTLASYFHQAGGNVFITRPPLFKTILDSFKPDFIVLSPGPGKPSDFNCSETIYSCRSKGIPIFGVCLGLQAIAEAYGGKLLQLSKPVHGKPSSIQILKQGIIFDGLPLKISVGRYHSIFVDPESFPKDLVVMAQTDDGVIMALEHRTEPVMAVQFHPESIMMAEENFGMHIIQNIVTHLPQFAVRSAA